jgi:hypothetical protein
MKLKRQMLAKPYILTTNCAPERKALLQWSRNLITAFVQVVGMVFSKDFFSKHNNE